MPPPPPPPPPPPCPPASAMATRFAAHWIADALAGDDSIDLSVLQTLLRASPDALAGAPEATRERLALRYLQELIAAGDGDDAAATAGLFRVDGSRSCEDALSRLVREELEKGLLPPFSQDIQESLYTKKLALPETSFQLLEGVDPWIGHTSSNQSGGKQSSPPWSNMRHEKESAVPSKSREGTTKQDKRRKTGSVHPQKDHSNPVAPTRRRSRVPWTEKEEAILRDAMVKFRPENGEQISWVQILRYGRSVFHEARRPSDLRVKWRNLMKKEASRN